MLPITMIDYGMGNIGSLRNMFKRIGVATEVTADATSIARAKKLLLPGVGAFDAAMQRIGELGLIDIIRKRALEDDIPILGICLGMQLLTDRSEEGVLPGLGLIAAEAKRFPRGTGLKVPHMGWNVVRPTTPSPLTARLAPDSRFYFVHSYQVQCASRKNSILSTRYGVDFDAAIQSGNIYGAQFHPEKSHRFGMTLLQSFADL
jgi:glutamine amidotransferase